MLTLKKQRHAEYYVIRDGKYLGAWLGDGRDIKRLVELSNEAEERQFAREGIPVCDDPNQIQMPLAGEPEGNEN